VLAITDQKKISRLLIDKAHTALYTTTKFTQNALVGCEQWLTPKHKKLLPNQSDSRLIVISA